MVSQVTSRRLPLAPQPHTTINHILRTTIPLTVGRHTAIHFLKHNRVLCRMPLSLAPHRFRLLDYRRHRCITHRFISKDKD
jgi:hypothetical protein